MLRIPLPPRRYPRRRLLVGDQRRPGHQAAQVAERLWRAGLWTQVRYKLSRNGEEFETPLVTAPAEKPLSSRITCASSACCICSSDFSFSSAAGTRRAPCISTFFAWFRSFSTRSTSAESWTRSTGSLLGQHRGAAAGAGAAAAFRAGVSGARGSDRALAVEARRGLCAAAAFCCWCISARHSNALGFVPWLGSRDCAGSARTELSGRSVSLLPGWFSIVSLPRSAAPAFLRQQLKWLTGGTLVGSLPFALLYIVPFVVRRRCRSPWMKFSALSLVLDSVVFRLRHHSLPADGRGHHLQARPGVHGGDRGRRGDLLRPGGADRADFPHAQPTARSAA